MTALMKKKRQLIVYLLHLNDLLISRLPRDPNPQIYVWGSFGRCLVLIFTMKNDFSSHSLDSK